MHRKLQRILETLDVVRVERFSDKNQTVIDLKSVETIKKISEELGRQVEISDFKTVWSHQVQVGNTRYRAFEMKGREH